MLEGEERSVPRLLHRARFDSSLARAIVVSFGLHALIVTMVAAAAWFGSQRIAPVIAHTVGIVDAPPGSPLLDIGPLGGGGGVAPAPSATPPSAVAVGAPVDRSADQAAAEAARKAAEEAARRAAEEAAAQAARQKVAVEQEAAAKSVAEQAAQEKAAAEAAAKQAEQAKLAALKVEETAKKKAAEDAAKKKTVDEAAKKKAADDLAKKKAADTATKKAADEAAKKKAADEVAKKKVAEESAKKKAAAEAEAKRKVAEAKAAADAARKRAADEAAAKAAEDARVAAARSTGAVGAGPGAGGGGGFGDATGGGGGGGGDVRGIEFVRYYEQMINKIRANWVWAGEDQSLAVTVRFSIQTDGRVSNVRRSDSSGNLLFDQSVESAVRGVRELGPPPDQYARDFSDVEVVFRAKDLAQ